jgi:hypothetical protein
MKTILIGSLLILSAQANAGEVICGKLKASAKTSYPINTLAIQIANKLGVKTCSRSERFKETVTKLKHTGKVIQVTKEQLTEAKTKLGAQTTGDFNW